MNGACIYVYDFDSRQTHHTLFLENPENFFVGGIYGRITVEKRFEGL